MISVAPGTKVFLACQPIDLRAGFNGLAAKVQQIVGQSPFDGSLFIFRGKRGQQPTFCIQFALCDACLSMAPTGRADPTGIALSPRQGPDVHLHR
jgi:transposase